MKTKNNLLWKNLIHIICWLIFIGCCIQAGGLLYSYIFSLFEPTYLNEHYLRLDLSKIYNENKTMYSLVAIVLIVTSATKALIFYYVLKLYKFFELEKPFTKTILNILIKITYCTAFIGILLIVIKHVLKNFSEKGYEFNLIVEFLEDGSTYIGIYIVLTVITWIFKKGIKLQTDNDLTL
ncbi:DUF2975 domain-containing protein [Sphingobacterium composti Ten et al. 2007 non Yoo et al. 2007]|uniref:DUF2975 domain-containing protein n=1 Tax=Sphingobacterium composti TaxID=363260 RepID=UPI00135C3584